MRGRASAGTGAAPPPSRRPVARRARAYSCPVRRRSTRSAAASSGRPSSSTTLASMSSASALARLRARRRTARPLRGVCGTSRLSVTLAHRGRLRVVGQRGLGVEGQHQHRRRARPRRPAAPGGRAPRPARSRGAPRIAARSPATRPRALARSVHRQLRVVRAGERVELARARHHVEHVGEVGHRADGVGKGLHLLHELGVLDLVERAAAVGQLHAGLQLAVALARRPAAPTRRCRRSGPRCRTACCRRGASPADAPAPSRR